MKSILQLILAYFARHLIDAAYQAGRNQNDSVRLGELNRQLNETLRLFIGKPVIAIVGEHDDLVVGVVIGVSEFTQDKLPYPIVSDYLSDNTQAVFGRLYPWESELFDTLMHLSPAQRWRITHSADSLSKLAMPLTQLPNDKPTLSLEQAVQRLQDKGFYTIVKDTA